MAFVRKLSAKTASCLTAAEIAKRGREKRTPLYNIMGVCTSTKGILTEHGESIALLGTFEAHDFESGEVNESATYYPPKFIADMINAQLAGDDSTSVKFALTVGVEPDPSTVLGYVYYVEQLYKGTNDPFSDLRELLPPPSNVAIEDKSAKKK